MEEGKKTVIMAEQFQTANTKFEICIDRTYRMAMLQRFGDQGTETLHLQIDEVAELRDFLNDVMVESRIITDAENCT